MRDQAPSRDTEAVLLLCGRFGGERLEPYQPLSAREYRGLGRWLAACKLQPADLLTDVGQDGLAQVQQAVLDRQRVEFLLGRGTALALALERWGRNGIWVVSAADAEFPERLQRNPEQATPPLLYGVGEKALLNLGGLAIIGSRDASEEALDYTRALAGRCAREGLGVVSGGARGVDAAAMQGVTEAGGVAIGVLASDLLKSSVNRQNRIGLQAGRLLLVSPFYPEAGFHAGNAMARNRYIYMLADQALVVDAALRSGGTWEGAVEDLRHRWVPLFVRMPGLGAGNAELVQHGALPFTFSFESESAASAQSLREYLTQEASAWPQQSLLEAREPQAGVIAAGSGAPAGNAESAATSPLVDRTCSDHGPAPSPQRPSSLDMFEDFLDKVAVLLNEGPKSEAELAAALRIEKAQAKAWLKRATDSHQVLKLKKPVRYASRRQASLC